MSKVLEDYVLSLCHKKVTELGFRISIEISEPGKRCTVKRVLTEEVQSNNLVDLALIKKSNPKSNSKLATLLIKP